MPRPVLVAGARWGYWLCLWASVCLALLLAALPARADSISDALQPYGSFPAVIEGGEIRIYGDHAPAGSIYFCAVTVTDPVISPADPGGCGGRGGFVPLAGDVYGWSLTDTDWSNPTCDDNGCTWPTFERLSITVHAFGPAAPASGGASGASCGGGDCLSEATFEGWAQAVAACMAVVIWSLGMAHGRAGA